METKRKYSRKRRAILDYLLSTEEHPSAEMIYTALKPAIPDLSLATVYRNLTAFCEEGTAVRVCTVNGQDRFDGKTNPHPHFICRRCGKVSDAEFSIPVIESLSESSPDGFLIETCSLNFTGLCHDCIDPIFPA